MYMGNGIAFSLCKSNTEVFKWIVIYIELKDMNLKERMKEVAVRWKAIAGTDTERQYKRMAMDVPPPDLSQLTIPQIKSHATFLHNKVTELVSYICTNY